MPDFQQLDLGQIYSQAANLNAARDASAFNKLRMLAAQEELAAMPEQRQRARAVEARAATEFSQEQRITQLRLLNAASAEIASNPSAAARWQPELAAAGLPNQPMDQASAKQVFESTSKALQAFSQNGTGGRVQSTQILQNGNIGIVTSDGRVVDTGQAAKPQIVVRDVNGVPTIVNATGAGASVTPLSTVESEAAARGQITSAEATARERAGAVAEQNKELTANQRTLEVWNVAKKGLVGALSGTSTGPVQGRLPAVTANQQIAEGAVAAVAPVLKQLFRSAGEGVFTDRDQALLLEMVPDRGDHPETVQAKIEMIDAIIQAKLAASIPGDDPQPQTTGPAQIRSDDEYNALPSGAQYIAPDGSTRTKR